MSINPATLANTNDGAAMLLPGPSQNEILHASRFLTDRLRQTDLSVPSIRCGGCIQKIERALNALEDVESARVNLTSKRVCVVWAGDGAPPPFVKALIDLGHTVHLESLEGSGPDRALSELVRALAVAGFATGNIMLLSVSIWSGADSVARNLFHAVSALIALPAVAYSGRVFFRSAVGALRHGHTNMDVPISIGVLLTCIMSLFETVEGGQHAYFEASVMLLFFLLIGRTLEHMMREKARRAVSGLAKLVPRVVQVVRGDGFIETHSISDVAPGTTVFVAAGERIPIDGRVAAGTSTVDQALVTGESSPRTAMVGSLVQAGTLNLTGPLNIEATATERDSFLSQMVRLMEAAEAGRPVYRRIADKAARLYAPVVHGAAFASFVGWMIVVGDFRQSAVVAVAVLIITCPCALGLAVPMVQVVAARRLFERGIMLKDGAALERLTEIDTVVFDKTGTLTMGTPVLRNKGASTPAHLAIAAAMASHSHHPISKELATIGYGLDLSEALGEVVEHPGLGLEVTVGPDKFRLGRAVWALDKVPAPMENADQTECVLSKNGALLEVFRFHDPLRPGVGEAISALKKRGLTIHLLSGDRLGPVRQLASDLNIDAFEAEVQPRDKVIYLDSLATEGRKILMVGDGLNDAPALAAAHAAMAPGSAVDIGRNAADLVFLGDNLTAIPFALTLARNARRLVRQNFVLAIIYNAVALPFAVFGFVTPLLAALAMSLSSVVVVANALRLNIHKKWFRRSRANNTVLDRTEFLSEPAE